MTSALFFILGGIIASFIFVFILIIFIKRYLYSSSLQKAQSAVDFQKYYIPQVVALLIGLGFIFVWYLNNDLWFLILGLFALIMGIAGLFLRKKNLDVNAIAENIEKHKKRNNILFLVFLSFLVIAGAIEKSGINFNKFFNFAQSDQIQVAEVQDQTASWQTYTNSKYGFELKYPEEVKVEPNNPSDSFSTANLLQIYYPADASNEVSEFFPVLTITIIRQPYVYKGKIYDNIEEFAALKEWNRDKTIRSQNAVVLGLIKGLKISGNYNISQDNFNEILAILPNKDIIAVDYPDKFSEIASTFKFIAPAQETTLLPITDKMITSFLENIPDKTAPSMAIKKTLRADFDNDRREDAAVIVHGCQASCYDYLFVLLNKESGIVDVDTSSVPISKGIDVSLLGNQLEIRTFDLAESLQTDQMYEIKDGKLLPIVGG